MRRRGTARLITTVLISALAVLLGDGVAWAHAGGLSSSSNEPAVLAVSPPVPGLAVSVVEYGARLRLDNHTGGAVSVRPPPGSVVNALPVVADGGYALWSDPRVMVASGQPRPPDARVAWGIPLLVGTGDGARPARVVGEQRWPAPPDATLWWLVTLCAAGLPVGLVALSGRSPGRAGGWVLAISTAVVVVSHVVHMFGSSLVVAQGNLLWVFLAAAGFAVLGWPIGAAGVWLSARGRAGGPLLCCVAGALLAVIIAPADVFSFHDAVIPFAWGADLDRLLIALTVGGGLGVLVAAWLLMRRAPATPIAPVTPTAPATPTAPVTPGASPASPEARGPG